MGDALIKPHSSTWRKTETGHESVPLYTQDPNEAASRIAALEAAWLTAEAQLSEISAAIGTVRFMDPPDGGDVPLAEQVRRMRAALDGAEAKLATAVDGLNWVSTKGSCPMAGGKARQTLASIQERT